jgi:ABC-type transport system involved in multi-copper enzyme maturation permease subunit
MSTFATVPVNVFATIMFYLVCHVKTGFLHDKLVGNAGGAVKVVLWPLYYIIPNLEDFNISQQVGYGGGVSWAYLLRVGGYAILFASLFLILAYLLFRKKDL